MDQDRRLTIGDIEGLQRSLGACGSLPSDQVRLLLEESARLIREREAMQDLISTLGPPWRDVRGALNSIHRLLQPDVPTAETHV